MFHFSSNYACLCFSSANAAPEFEGRGGEELAAQISSTLAQAFNNHKCLDLTTLCVIPRQQCWVLYVDILVRMINIFENSPLLDIKVICVKKVICCFRTISARLTCLSPNLVQNILKVWKVVLEIGCLFAIDHWLGLTN